MNHLVSILIPAYNAEKWIADTIRSAQAQTWQPKEIIIVDDGSTDATFEIAKKFESESVRVHCQENAGPSAARNTAFSLCRGEYIQWLDADDLLAPTKIELQMQVARKLQSERTLLSSPFGTFLFRPRKAQFDASALWCDLSPAEFLVRKMGQKLSMQTSVWLVTRKLTEAAGPWDVKMAVNNDGEYFSRVILASDGIRFVPDAKVYYRSVGATSVSYIGRSNKKLDALWRGLQLHIGYLRSLEDSERVRAACVSYLHHYLIDFYPLRLDIVEQMRQTARDLGGTLEDPTLSWKYSWIQKLFGWELAHRAQMVTPNVRWSMVRAWDQVVFQLESWTGAQTNSVVNPSA